MNTHDRVNKVLSDTSLIMDGKIYKLKDLYRLVELHGKLTPIDYQKEKNGDIRWVHAVRSIVGKRITSSTKRSITYYGNTKYSFM